MESSRAPLLTTHFIGQAAGSLEITCAEEVRLQKRIREHRKLAWNRGAFTTTDARRYKAEGYFLLAFKGLLAQFLGMNLTWRAVRALSAISQPVESHARIVG